MHWYFSQGEGQTENISSTLYRNCTVLKVPHHGSKNGLNQEWLQAVSPQVAVISAGRSNRYGHPDSSIVSMLRDAGIPLLRTDKDGTVSIESDGKGWRLADGSKLARGPPIVAAPREPGQKLDATDLKSSDLNATKSAGNDAAKEIIVYVTRTGKKYHTKSCRYGKRSSRSLTLEEAQREYEPCKICKPPQ